MKGMKQWHNSEQEANEYMKKHRIFNMVAEKPEGSTKWALVFPLEAHVTVHQPHAPC
jgi:hypothetical protein